MRVYRCITPKEITNMYKGIESRHTMKIMAKFRSGILRK